MNKKTIKIGEWFFKHRDYTPITLIIILILISQFNLIYFIIGIVLTLIGEFIRFYSVAFIGGISRTRKGSVSNLITEGPFNCVRNPLYLGNFILSLGISFLSSNPFFLLAYIILFWIQYIPIVLWEEELLLHKFGEAYIRYKSSVPRFFPKFNCKPWKGKKDFKKALKSEKSTLLTIFGLYLIISVKFFVLKI